MPARVQFLTESESDAERFIREYVLDLIERTDDIEGCNGVTFALNEEPNPDGGSVGLIALGDAESFIDHERPLWEQHRDNELITEWETTITDEERAETKFGEQGADLAQRLFPLAAEMSKHVYEEFDEFPDIVDEFPDEEIQYPLKVGWWGVPHHITFANLGYSAAEEMAMCLNIIEEDLRIYAERNSEDAVDDKIDELIDTLEGMRDDVTEGRPQP